MVLIPLFRTSRRTLVFSQFSIKKLCGETIFRKPNNIANPRRLPLNDHGFNAATTGRVENSSLGHTVHPCEAKNVLQAADVGSLQVADVDLVKSRRLATVDQDKNTERPFSPC